MHASHRSCRSLFSRREPHGQRTNTDRAVNPRPLIHGMSQHDPAYEHGEVFFTPPRDEPDSAQCSRRTKTPTSRWANRDRVNIELRLTGILMLSLLFAGCDADRYRTTDQGEVLRFSAIPDQNTTELREKFDPLAKHLAGELGVPVEYVPAIDYKASVESFKNGDIQLAWFGGLTGVQARHAITGARAIAQGEEDPRFVSYFIAHKNTGLEEAPTFPPDIGRFTFAFGSKSSTSGRLMPEYFIRRHAGKSPRAFFSAPPVYSGNHDATIELVESGRVQLGAVNYRVYEKRVAAGKTDPTVCKVIWKTPEYADYNFTAHPELEVMFGEGFIDQIQTVLIAIKDPQLLQAFPRRSLIKARNEDFADVAAVARELGFLR